MKKVSFFVLLTVLLASGLVFAEEQAPPQTLVLPSFQKVEGNGLAFEFLFSPGKLSQAQTGKIFTTGYHAPDFTLPSLKEEPTPIPYPRWAVREGWEGTFVIAVEVLTNGQVGRWAVVQSTGYSLLDQAATQAIRKWHFNPGTELGKAIVSCIQIPIYFKLQD